MQDIPISNDDTRLRASDIDSSLSSGKEVKMGMHNELQSSTCTMQFDETVLLENDSLLETQLVTKVDDLSGETQVLETKELDDLDHVKDMFEKENVIDYSAGGTERTDVLSPSDGESDDGTTQKLRDFSGEKETVDVVMDSQKETVVPPLCNNKGWDESVVNPSASIDEHGCSVARCRHFTSVHAASIRSSGIAAARRMTLKGTQIKPNPTFGIHQDCQKQDDAKFLHPGIDCIKKCWGTTSLGDPISLFGSNIHEQGRGHEHDCSPGNMQGKLMDGNNRRIRNSRVRRLFNNGPADGNGEKMNETGSTVMGEAECSTLVDQADAVAGLSYIGSLEPSEQQQELALGIVDNILFINDVELVGQGSPQQSIGGKSSPISSARGAQCLAKRAEFRTKWGKEGIYDWIDSREDDGGGDFFTKRKDVLLEGRECFWKSHTRALKVNHGEKGEAMDSSSHQKLLGVSHLDSRLMSHSPVRSAEMWDSGTESKKNLLKEIGEGSNEETFEQETTAIAGGSEGAYDVGVSTQLAAEALEALVCGPPVNHDFMDAHPVSRKIIEGSNMDLKNNKDHQKHVSTRKRARSTGTSFIKCLTNTSTKDYRRESPVKTRSREKLKFEEILDSGNYVNGNECSGGKSSNPGKGDNVEKVGASSGIYVKEVDKFCNALASNRHLPCDKASHGTVTPVAHRTRHRQSITKGIITDASEHLAFKDQSSKVHLVMRGIEGLDGLVYPKRRRTRRGMSAELMNATNLTVDSFAEANADSWTWRKRSKTGDGSIFVSLGTVARKTRSASVDALPSLPPAMDIRPKQEYVASGLPPHKTNAECTFVNDDADSSKLSVENAENSSFEGLSKDETQLPRLSCTTPLKDINAISPICTCDCPQEQLGKKGLSRPHSTRKLLRSDTDRAAQNPVLKDRRRRRDMGSVRVLFSHHLGEDIIKQQKKILARLGLSIASSSSDATHFIADKFARTRNMLETMALGKPVVTHLWLESCGQASCFIDEKKYILRDIKKEKEIGFSMPVSLARACHSPLLKGKRVFITRSVKPDKELIASLVKAAHGQAIERMGRSAMKDERVSDNLLVISCEEDYTICLPLLERGLEVYSSELLLNGIVTQKLEYGRHRLFLDRIKRTRSTLWLRKEDDNQFCPVTKLK